jgi:hypothetical protein
MKKNQKYILDAITFIIAFYSCSNENVSSQKLLQKMVETTEDGLSETTFAYDGNKITSINSPNSRTDFTYTDGLISKIVLLNKKN